MSSRKRICVVITARPSYSRVRTVLEHLQKAEDIDLQVVCSGSSLLERYGRVVDLIRADGYNVIEELYTFVEGNEPINMALTTANTINQTASLLRKLKPDWVMSIADRYETLGTAIASAYVGVPLIHLQGGEITGNIDEKVRHSKTKLADIHLVSNEYAAQRLLRMGENPSAVFNTGCPSIDLARESKDIALDQLQKAVDELGVGERIDLSKDFLVLMQHPETDRYEQSYDRMQASLQALEALNLQALIFWPNVDAGSDATSKAIRVFRESGKCQHVRYMKNLEGHLFLRLLAQSRCLIGNSSVGIRECGYLGVPVVNIGDRQYGRERGENVRDVGWALKDIKAAIIEQIGQGKYDPCYIYGKGYAGKAIADVIRDLKPVTEKRFYEA